MSSLTMEGTKIQRKKAIQSLERTTQPQPGKQGTYRMEMTDGEPDKYDTFSRIPFIVYIRQPSVAARDNAQISVISISKKLVSANVKFQQIQRYSRNTWKLSFTSKSAANEVIKNKFLKDGIDGLHSSLQTQPKNGS